MRTACAFLTLSAVLLAPVRAWAQELHAAVAVLGGRVMVAGKPARVGTPLAAGDEITVERGEAVILFGGTKLRLLAGARLRVEEHSAAGTSLVLQSGRLEAWSRGAAGRRVRLRAGSAVAHVRDAVFSAGVEGGKSSFRLYEGELGVADDFGGGIILTKGQRVDVAELGLGGMGSLPPGENTPPAEPQTALAGSRRDAPGKGGDQEGDDAPESLPAPAFVAAYSPVQEQANSECAETVSPSAPCP